MRGGGLLKRSDEKLEGCSEVYLIPPAEEGQGGGADVIGCSL